mgnify:CR=1 FL=1
MKPYVRRTHTLYAKRQCQQARVSPTTAALAWAAGFIEGEGTFTPLRVKERLYQRLTAYQNNLEPLEKLQALFGGSIWGFTTKRTQARELGHTWHVNGARARGVMLTLWTFLSAKRRGQLRSALSGDY